MGEISAALSSVNTAIQIAKSVMGIQQDVTIKLEISKMLDAVFEAKTGLVDASEKIAALKQELQQAKDKLAAEADLSNYEYVKLPTGAQVVIRTGEDNGLQYCPTCFDSKQLRVLQTENADSWLRCRSCKDVFKRDFRNDEAIARAQAGTRYY